MISPELVRKIRYIQLRTRRTVTTAFAGEYRSVFRGQGMEFDEVKENIKEELERFTNAIKW
jgi:hypothetical protein